MDGIFLACCDNEQYERQAQRYILTQRPVPTRIEEKRGHGHNDKDEYFCPQCGNPIHIKDTTLILYNVPSNQPTFTGRRTMYNPQYNFVSKPYVQVNKQECSVGKKLELVSR